MEWYSQTLIWYAMVSIIGLIFFPFTKKLFSSFLDYGYPFAKALGILVCTYTILALASFTFIPFDRIALVILLGIYALLNYYTISKTKFKKDKRLTLIVVEEALFFLCFMTWAFVRSQEPSIRGLEKFMDFGFINSAVRGDTFPPQDMWLAGHTINYYYFGHLTAAFLTKLSNLPSYITYNLILAMLFALGVTQTFSIGLNLAYQAFKKNIKLSIITGALASFIVNLGGNLHTIYAFTKGYGTEKAVPFWQLEAKYTLSELMKPETLLEKLPHNYWYPNATRFIPLTIHEFPIYSYVVADLHGHVFDIPFVLLTIATLFVLFVQQKSETRNHTYTVLFLGFLAAVHYMTNAFDAPIYLLLTVILLSVIHKFSRRFFMLVAALVGSFILFSLPFTLYFEPFATGIGLNCAPELLVQMGSLGPFLFEDGNCQVSPWWMLVTLWGFFWFNFIFLGFKTVQNIRKVSDTHYFILILFAFSTLLIALPEFIYAKDIYPSHFRANTMFKMGYQAFIMMGIGSAFTFTAFKGSLKKRRGTSLIYLCLFVPLFVLIAIYPNFAISSFYGYQNRTPSLHGTEWLNATYPEYLEIISYLNDNVEGQPVILEAQGDSYTDYNVVSAYTGLPTVAGWWVHQWLWRGDSSVVGNLIPDIQAMYESTDKEATRSLLEKYEVAFVIIGKNEREKYGNIQESKFEALGQVVFISSNNQGKVIKILLDR
jgi:uncharacterized membrane protein